VLDVLPGGTLIFFTADDPDLVKYLADYLVCTFPKRFYCTA
jgi:hypothetical protein